GLKLSATLLLTHPTLAALADFLLGKLALDSSAVASSVAQAPSPAAESVVEAQQAPVSYGQRALWFVQRAAPESAPYNVVPALRLRGPLDMPGLQRALQQIVRRHPPLRTTYALHEGKVVQSSQPGAEAPFHLVDASSWSETELPERIAA